MIASTSISGATLLRLLHERPELVEAVADNVWLRPWAYATGALLGLCGLVVIVAAFSNK